MTVYEAVLTALISLLTSSVVTAFTTHKLSTSEKQREWKRQKLEQLYLCAVDYQNMLFGLGTMAAAYHAGKVKRDTITSLYNKDAEKHKDNNNNLNMLCNIYFPHLLPFLAAIRQNQEDMGNAGINAAVFGNEPDKEKGKQIFVHIKTQNQVFENFSQAVFKTGLKINKG